MTYQILLGNNLDILPTLPDNSVDSIVTDPPYELGFMGKKWDSSGIAYSVELWQQCLRVLKPGGHLLALVDLEPITGWQLLLRMLALRFGTSISLDNGSRHFLSRST
jgi:DNA modification methylase